MNGVTDWTRSMTRRDFIARAAAVGATLAWARPAVSAVPRWRERRDLFPEGVASGDPEPDSVILWTRRPFTPTERADAHRRGRARS